MKRTHVVKSPGAAWRLEPSPFGDRAKRQEWQERIDNFNSLEVALEQLLEWRSQQADLVLTDQDALWIEARLEERLAMLKFQEKTNEQIRTWTLTGESIADLKAILLSTAETASVREQEDLIAEFRRDYKPPVMPCSAFLQIEMLLSELLMKQRSLNWFEPSIAELREQRGIRVVKEGLHSI